MRLASISVDLDEIPNYFHIHGLSEPDGKVRSLVYRVAIERLIEFASSEKIPLTLFAIGSDLGSTENQAALKKAHSLGHEIANHSQDHLYDLSRREPSEINHQIQGGANAIRNAVGELPVGFRAPGYTISEPVFRALEELGYTYDSSVFPCPSYFAAKTAAICAISLKGRTSHSIVDTPLVLTAPTVPYRVGSPYYRRGEGMLEIPIQVTRGLRLPFIGTSVVMAKERAAWLAKMCVGDPLVNLELHGIDVLDAADGLEALEPYQFDVKIPKRSKLDSLVSVVAALKQAGYRFVTMKEAASQL